tara:strand:+ start:43 stop:327 length:285 start_codon:yes stop_codon:yes gene_type:complete
MAFKALSSLPKVFDARNVFEWQLSQRYYSVLPYWAAEITAYLPLLLVDVTVFASISYWMIGLNDDDGGSRYRSVQYTPFSCVFFVICTLEKILS